MINTQEYNNQLELIKTQETLYELKTSLEKYKSHYLQFHDKIKELEKKVNVLQFKLKIKAMTS